MKHFLPAVLATIIVSAVTSQASLAATVQTQSVQATDSSAFVDSIGVNVHMNDFDTAYGNFPRVKSALLALGVHHLRDGLVVSAWAPFYANHNALGAVGIKSIFTIEPGQSPQLWDSFPSMMNKCFEGYENANEMDDDKGSNWLSVLLGEIPALSNAVRGKSNSFPVYGPALVYQQSYSEVGNVSRYIDYGNVHNYPGGKYPESSGWGAEDAEGHLYGSIAWQKDLLHIDSPGLPWVTTETGYTNQQSSSLYVPQWVAATYLPRLALYNWSHGATRTYMYELISDGNEDYGLIDSSWNRKPAFYALANLLTLLADPGPGFYPGTLKYGIGGGDSNLHQVLLQKRNGTFYLALWLGESCYDVDTRQETYVQPESIDLQLPSGMRATRYQWNGGGNVAKTTMTSSDLADLPIKSWLTIIEITPAN